MADTYEPTSLTEYLTAPMESPSDAPAAEELQPDGSALQDDQSRPDDEGGATPDDPEQSDAPETESDEAGAESADSPEPPASQPVINWDDPENPYRKQAEELERLKAFAAEKQAERERAEARERLIEAGKRIVEVDEEDLGPLMGDFIDEIAESSAKPYMQQIEVLNHGMTALVAAVQTLPAAQQEAIKKVAAEFRELGSTSDEIERAFTVSQRERQAASQREADLQKQIRNLTAQLAARQIQDSGANRTETVAVGGAGNEDPKTWRDLLGGGPL